MTTATGQYVLDFKAESPEDPWSDANWTVRTGGFAITSGSPNYLRPDPGGLDYTTNLASYEGSTYAGSTWSVRVECGSLSDRISLFIGNSGGAGYSFRFVGSSAVIQRHEYWANGINAAIRTASSFSVAAGDVVEFSLTAGSPNTFKMKKNGVEHASWDGELSDSTHTISEPRCAFGFVNFTDGAQSVRSVGVDYEPVVLPPAGLYPDAMTRRYQHMLIR